MRPDPNRTLRRALSGWLGLVLGLGLGIASSSTHAAEIDIQDIPVFLLQGAPPNFILSLDDSARMNRGYAPERLSEGITRARQHLHLTPDQRDLLRAPSRLSARPERRRREPGQRIVRQHEAQSVPGRGLQRLRQRLSGELRDGPRGDR